MDLAPSLRAGPALLRRCPAGVLPYYLLVASVPTIARVPLVVGIGAAVAWIAATGRLDPVVAALRDLDLHLGAGVRPSPGPAPATGVGAGGAGSGATLPRALVRALAGLVTPTTVALVGAGLVASLGCLLVARAVTAAGALAAVERALDGGDALAGGARGMVRHWRTFLWLTVARVGAWTAALAAGGLVVGVAATGVAAGGVGAAAGLLVGVAGGLAVLVGIVAAELWLTFAGAAAVVDGVGTRPALRRGAGLARDRPAAVLLYLVVGAAALVGIGTVGGVLVVAGASRLLGVVTALVVAPVLGGVRVALYAGRGPAALPEPTGSIRRRAGDAVRDGLVALARFVRERPVENAASVGLLAAGAVLGWLAVAPYRLALSPPGGVAGVFGTVPIGPFLDIAANNWLIASGMGYGGLALGLPSATSLVLNGALVGAVAAAFDPTSVAALVVPHGVIELPAIAVGGGVGIRLGRVGAAALRGRRDAAEVGTALREALRVLVGLAVVLVVAAAVETVVTPRVAAAVLG
ncbi:MAG: stage II sporulation protein M [Haloferacaceae archaeon]